MWLSLAVSVCLPVQASLAQEQSERGRLLSQMREMLSGPRGGGAGSEELERLRGEAVRRNQEAAAAAAGRERAEAQAATWKKEARALRERLVAAERVGVRKGLRRTLLGEAGLICAGTMGAAGAAGGG